MTRQAFQALIAREAEQFLKLKGSAVPAEKVVALLQQIAAVAREIR